MAIWGYMRMYKIDEGIDKEKYILLVPSMLDMHFPLLKYAFYSKNYHPVILENEENVVYTGLKYVNNDMCYPSILNVGQMVAALQSGQYDPERTRLLMPSAGDACRGANYFGVLKRAVEHAGFPQVKVMSLNLKGIDKDAALQLEFGMVWRALLAVYYGDLLMFMLHQTRPYEKTPGAALKLWQEWIDRLAEDFKAGKNLTLRKMIRNFDLIAADFEKLEKTGEKKQRVGLVGEIYIKYCHMGNWNMVRFLEEQGCESHTNGVTWYAMYYMDSHLVEAGTVEGLMYRIGYRFFSWLQRKLVEAVRRHGFYSLEPFPVMKKEAQGYVSFETLVGDGWLIGAEAVGHILHDCPKVLAMQPFGCMPNHVCGRGLYPSLQRKLNEMGHLTSVDVDAGSSELNVYNRVKMLLDT